MSKLRLSLSCWNYDWTRALLDGCVPVDGIDLNYLRSPVEETFFRMLRFREFDVAELSLSSYVITLFDKRPPFIAIPVFPSRTFRHSNIYINRSSGIRTPKDLLGKRVGVPEYQLTAAVWIRGLLSDEYAVPVASPCYFTGGLEEPGRTEKLKLSLPSKFHVERIDGTKTLARMLENGEIDALYSPRAPSSLNSPNVCQLFKKPYDEEKEYFRKTQIFPIMHVLVIRREVYEANRWVARSLYKAFVKAQCMTYRDLHEVAALKFMLPWLHEHVADTKRIMGENFWPYGFEPNMKALETFLRYSYEQGLSKHCLKPHELFAQESLESFKI